jgi:phage terminase large subunit-like protein
MSHGLARSVAVSTGRWFLKIPKEVKSKINMEEIGSYEILVAYQNIHQCYP